MFQNTQQKIAGQFFVFDDSIVHKRRGSVVIDVQCRICLQTEADGMAEGLISPCQCSGSIKYVHFNCMVTWIQKNQPAPSGKLKNIGKYECEMCKHTIEFQCLKKGQLNGCPQFKQKIMNHRITFFFLVLSLLLCMGLVLTGFAIISNSHFFSLSGQPLFQSLVILISTILLMLLTCVSAYVLIIHFAMKQVYAITKIHLPKIESPRKRSVSPQKSTMSEVSSQMKRRRCRSSDITSFTLYPLDIMIQNMQ